MLQKFQEVNKSKFFTILRLIVSVSIIWYLLQKIKVESIIGTLQYADRTLILAAISLTIPTMLLRIYKWYRLIPSQYLIPGRDIVYMYAVGVFFSSFTPAKLGDLIRIRYLQLWGLTKKKALYYSFIDRVFDLMGICTFATGAILLHNSLFIVSGLSILFLLFSSVLFLTRSGNIPLLSSSKQKLIQKVLIENASMNWLLFWILSIIIWTLLGVQTWLILQSFSQYISLLYVLGTITSGAIVGLIPFSFSGYGFREGFIVWVLTLAGVQVEIAIFTAFFYTFISFLIPAIVFGLYYILCNSSYEKRPLSLRHS